MKLVRLFGHPIVLIIIYLLLIIEGDNFGGFFVLYLILSLPHGALYAVLAALGIASLIVAFNFKNNFRNWITAILYLFGYILMIVSLLVFFAKGNKWESFTLGIPLMSFILFGLTSLFFLFNSITIILRDIGKTDKSYSI